MSSSCTGLMNLGVPGVVAVGSNITHKFGKAMVGSSKHGEAGNVDKKLAVFLLATAICGIQVAVSINSLLFKGGAGSHGEGAGAARVVYVNVRGDDVGQVFHAQLLHPFPNLGQRGCGTGLDENPLGPFD